jgi:uncharacterized protein (DUF1684 family)
MKRILLCIGCGLSSLVTEAQTSYLDSLLAFQHHYKKELYALIKEDTASVKFYPVDPNYRVLAKVERLSGEKFFPMATSSGISKQAIRYAKLTFLLNEKEYVLYGYQLSMLLETDKYKNDFFIPFLDGTSGTDSYIGGKYIDFSTKDISPANTLLLDFNRSYNPYCAFKKGFNCPIPPGENALTVEIWAGEMDFYK